MTTTRSQDLLDKLGLFDIDTVVRERRLRWYGHVLRSNGPLKNAYDLKVAGKRGRGRPKMSWTQVLKKDCESWGLAKTDPHDRKAWRKDVKAAMSAASRETGEERPYHGGAPRPAL